MQWEYDVTDAHSLEECKDIADKWGQGHWELVTVVQTTGNRQQILYRGFFKRRLDEAVEEPIDYQRP